MPNVVPRPHVSPSYLGDFDLNGTHKNECYLAFCLAYLFGT